MTFKKDLLHSTSGFTMGLNHVAVERDRQHMNELVQKAEAGELPTFQKENENNEQQS